MKQETKNMRQPATRQSTWGRAAILVTAGLALVGFAAGCPKPASEKAPVLDEHGHAAETPGAAQPPAQEMDEHGHAAETHGAAQPPAEEMDEHGHAAGTHGGEGEEDEVTLTEKAIAENQVITEPVAARVLYTRFVLPAQVVFNAEKSAQVGTPVAGRVTKICVQPGDRVKKGDALLVIESAAAGEAQSNYLQKRILVKTAEGALALAAATAERGDKLKASGTLSKAEIAKRETDKAAAENALVSAKAERLAAASGLRLLGFDDAALEDLEQPGAVSPTYTVRASIDGMVVEREVTLGEVVGPEDKALARLADTQALWVLAAAPENRMAEVAVGAPAEVLVDALEGKAFAGKVTYVAPSLNEVTRTAQVRIVLEDAASAKRLRAGMFARAVVNVLAKDDAVLAVPEGAVLTVEGGPAVFVAVEGEAGAFRKRAIKPGTGVNGWVPVLSGLKAGEKVVTGGTFILKAELAKGVMEGKTCTGH